MKFRLAEEQLHESNNTNLRKFLLELVRLANIRLDFENPVVHHTKKDTQMNSIEDLVLMGDHDHRSMHAKYRNKEWDNNAHKSYKYTDVELLMSRALYNLQKQSYEEEQQLSK